MNSTISSSHLLNKSVTFNNQITLVDRSSLPTLMSLTSLMVRSIVRLLTTLIREPVASISTMLYYSGLLPQNVVLTRMVRHDLLLHDNYLFRFIIDLLYLF